MVYHALPGLLLLLAAHATALPAQQYPFSSSSSSRSTPFNPLHHLSGISPYFNETQHSGVKGCTVTSAVLLIRHSSITANDDEWEETMKPFVEKLPALHRGRPDNAWNFLADWESPVTDENLEDLAESGAKDAELVGRQMRQTYKHLYPPPLSEKGPPPDETFKIWSASSSRDVDSAKAFIKGSFLPSQRGKDGEGDGTTVQLHKVPNNEKDWALSLTPHKVCDAFSKEPSLLPAQEFLGNYAPKIIERLRPDLEDIGLEADEQDILAMQMLCGYETVIRGSSPFCGLFTEDEWLDFESYFDIRYHYMVGYGNPISAPLGMPFISTATHLLKVGINNDPDHHDGEDGLKDDLKKKKPKLPPPEAPPNATHTQLLHFYFTHREEPTTLAVALGLFNETGGDWKPSLEKRDDDRAWRTSSIIPFLGNVAFERLACDSADAQGGKKKKKPDVFVRILTNETPRSLPGCDSGPGGSCPWADYKTFVNDRFEKWGDFAKACEKKE